MAKNKLPQIIPIILEYPVYYIVHVKEKINSSEIEILQKFSYICIYAITLHMHFRVHNIFLSFENFKWFLQFGINTQKCDWQEIRPEDNNIYTAKGATPKNYE